MSTQSEPLTTTSDRLVAVLRDVLSLDADVELTPDTGLFGSLPELDSLALVELITALEVEFGFEMDEDDITAENFEDVDCLVRYVAAHRGT